VRLWVFGLLALVAILEGLARRTPPPDVGEFSEARAREIISRIAGRRMIGTPAHDQAARFLADELRQLPRVEVEVQDYQGAMPWPIDPSLAAAVRVRNVLARLPGDSPEAILISAHYDGPWESPAAADDGLAVGVAVEVLRALAHGPRLPRTVLVVLDGGEEVGLLGAAAFLSHPWAKTVRAFVNLEGMPKGPTLLFQAGAPSLVAAYARAAPRPYAAVWLQELFQRRLFHNDTNYHVLRDAGLSGLDLSSTDDAWAYHTALDAPARLGSGTPQYMGDDLLATVRELARSPLPARAEPSVYYDLLGRVMFAYSMTTAKLLMAAALLFTAVAIFLGLRRGAFGARQLFVVTGRALLTVVAALAGAVIVAAILAFALGRRGTWFASPWSGILAYGLVALTAATLVRHRSDDKLAAWAGAQLLWSLLGLLATLANIASAYLALWWILPGALMLALVIARPRAWPIAWTLAVAPGLLVLAAPLSLAGRLLVPQSWSLGASGFDLVLAAAIALPVALAAPSLVLPLAGRATALLLAVLTLVALVHLASRPPYTPERPMRVYAAHIDGELGVTGIGSVPLALEGFHPGKVDVLPGLPAQLQRSVAPSGAIAPSLEVVGNQVHLRAPGAAEIDLLIPRDRLEGWSLGDLPPLPNEAHRRVLLFFGSDEWWFTVRLRGDGSVPIEASATYPTQKTPELIDLARRLPLWTTLAGVVLANGQLSL
jgi:hypothetical protein